jgi:hypothetical protein
MTDDEMNEWLTILHKRLERLTEREMDATILARTTGVLTPPAAGAFEAERTQITKQIDQLLDAWEARLSVSATR